MAFIKNSEVLHHGMEKVFNAFEGDIFLVGNTDRKNKTTTLIPSTHLLPLDSPPKKNQLKGKKLSKCYCQSRCFRDYHSAHASETR